MLLLFTGCCTKKVQETPIEKVVTDTIYVPYNDTLQIMELSKEVQFWKDSVYVLNNTVKLEDYLNATKVEKIKHYINITERNPKNRTFFYGWVKRTISD